MKKKMAIVLVGVLLGVVSLEQIHGLKKRYRGEEFQRSCKRRRIGNHDFRDPEILKLGKDVCRDEGESDQSVFRDYVESRRKKCSECSIDYVQTKDQITDIMIKCSHSCPDSTCDGGVVSTHISCLLKQMYSNTPIPCSQCYCVLNKKQMKACFWRDCLKKIGDCFHEKLRDALDDEIVINIFQESSRDGLSNVVHAFLKNADIVRMLGGKGIIDSFRRAVVNGHLNVMVELLEWREFYKDSKDRAFDGKKLLPLETVERFLNRFFARCVRTCDLQMLKRVVRLYNRMTDERNIDLFIYDKEVKNFFQTKITESVTNLMIQAYDRDRGDIFREVASDQDLALFVDEETLEEEHPSASAELQELFGDLLTPLSPPASSVVSGSFLDDIDDDELDGVSPSSPTLSEISLSDDRPFIVNPIASSPTY